MEDRQEELDTVNLRAPLLTAHCPPTFLLNSTPKPIVREQEDSVNYGGGQGESQKFHSVYLLGISPRIFTWGGVNLNLMSCCLWKSKG